MSPNFPAPKTGLLTVNSGAPNFPVSRVKRLSGFYITRRSTPSKKSIAASIVAVKNQAFPVPSGPIQNPILQRKALAFPTSPHGTFRPKIFANETLYQLSYTPRSLGGFNYARGAEEGKQKSRRVWGGLNHEWTLMDADFLARQPLRSSSHGVAWPDSPRRQFYQESLPAPIINHPCSRYP